MMIAAWRLVSVLAMAAFWTQPGLQSGAPGQAQTPPASAQAASPGQANSPAGQNGAPASTAPTGNAANPDAQSSDQEQLQAPTQPVPFSHKQHAGKLQLPCEFCHAPRRLGSTVKIPQASLCMQCHQTMDTNNPGVQKLAQYAKTNSLIPWTRIYQLPSFVSFSHKVHMQHGATCQECHGQVADRVQMYKEADISMATCIKCHEAMRAKVGCDTCHHLD